MLGELGWADRAADRRDYLKRMGCAREGGAEEELYPKELRRGWVLGGEVFRERVLALVDRLSDCSVRCLSGSDREVVASLCKR